MNPVDQAEQLIRQGGHAHFIGIGGIGMAGVAWLLKQRGWKISGCDLQQNRQTQWLEKNGCTIASDHDASHITASMDWLIRSTAVPDTHPEVQQAKAKGIPVSRRGEVLPALLRDRIGIAVSGTHGKTTTTAIIAQILNCGYCIGGEMVGVEEIAMDGDIMVVEADESDGTVVGYTPDYSVITNVEYDHMEHHDSEAAFIGCFEQLIHNTKQKVFFCADDPISANLCAGNPKCEPFALPDTRVPLPLPGAHNQWNAAAAIAVSKKWMDISEIFKRLERIRPLRRRFETVLVADGIRIITDYAHHPTEIAALIKTAAERQPRRLLGIFQPHRYTRTLALGSDFPAAFQGLEHLWLTPVYAASEPPLAGGSSADLADQFPEEWAGRLHLCASLAAAWKAVKTELRDGDCLLLIGAGDIEQVANWAAKWCPGEGSNLRPSD